MKIDAEKLIEIIKEEAGFTDSRTSLIGISEVAIGKVGNSHVTVKIYSKEDAEEEQIPEPVEATICIKE